MRRRLDVPIALETDVNGAAYGEFRWGAGRGLHSSAYLTVGTGVGGGAIVGGQPLRGLLHPEMGHLHVQRHPTDDFPGSCPFHGDCLEGMASGPAISRRSGRPPDQLGSHEDHVVEIEAWYLAQLVTAVIYLLTPERIVLGGGVLKLPGLLELIRCNALDRLGGALDGTTAADDMDGYLVPPALGSSSGVLGTLALAERAATSDRSNGDSPKGWHPLSTQDVTLQALI
jgi:fructokinase